jgi:hypothetical protein
MPEFLLNNKFIPNANMLYTKDLISKILEIEAEIAGVAGSYDQNRQRKYQEFYIKDWTTRYSLWVSITIL